MRLVALAVVAATTVAACTGGDDDTSPTTAVVTTTTVPARANDGILSLAAYLPRTGPGSDLGLPMIKAIDQAVRDINRAGGVLGNPVDLQFVDENSGTGMADLVARGFDAIIGPASSNIALAELGSTVQPGREVVTCSPSATAIALDDFPDNNYFFRTVPSDSMQMAAIARRAGTTGVASVSVGYLDDPYGRALAAAFRAETTARGIKLAEPVPFAPDLENLTPVADSLLATNPGVIVVLGDADDGTRLLTQIDARTVGTDPPQVFVNDALRDGRQTIQTLSEAFRQHVTGVAPRARAQAVEFDGFFTANAVDCVNLIALAAVVAGSDSPKQIQSQMAAVSAGGKPCVSFADCVEKNQQRLQIDYVGLSSSVDLSTSSGDLRSGWFELFQFDSEGADVEVDSMQVP